MKNTVKDIAERLFVWAKSNRVILTSFYALLITLCALYLLLQIVSKKPVVISKDCSNGRSMVEIGFPFKNKVCLSDTAGKYFDKNNTNSVKFTLDLKDTDLERNAYWQTVLNTPDTSVYPEIVTFRATKEYAQSLDELLRSISQAESDYCIVASKSDKPVCTLRSGSEFDDYKKSWDGNKKMTENGFGFPNEEVNLNNSLEMTSEYQTINGKKFLIITDMSQFHGAKIRYYMTYDGDEFKAIQVRFRNLDLVPDSKMVDEFINKFVVL